MASPMDTTSDHPVDIDLDHFSKDQLRQLLGDDEYNEEALEFSDDADEDNTKGTQADHDESLYFSDTGAGNEGYDDSDISDYEDSAQTKQQRYQTLADLGFSEEEDNNNDMSDDDSDDEFVFRNALREARNFKVKKKKKKDTMKKKGGLAALRRKIRRTELDPEVKVLLSKANEAFVTNDLDAALPLYVKVIKIDKNNFSAYKTLGEIYKMKNELNKCSNIWLLAAHLNPSDVEFWKTVAELSVELGHFKQAIYCYRRAITSSKGQDYAAIFARACLYREVGKFKRASTALLKLRSLLPHDPKIVRELAKVYVEEGRVSDAITLYTKILDDNVKFRNLLDKGEMVVLDNIKFDWSELNILSELYSSKAAWALGIKSLRQISRWIQERESQVFWDENGNADIEFDERRFDHPRYQKLQSHENGLDYSLPIDIRVQLGIFRLNNKNEEESMKHFAILLDQPVEDAPDLYYKVGMELEGFALFREALEFLIPLSYYEDYNTSELVMIIAKCLRETEDFENAKDTYIRLLEYDSDNIDLKIALAECYFYLNDVESANKLYKEAKAERSKEKASARDNLETSRSAEYVKYVAEAEEDDDEEDDEVTEAIDPATAAQTQAIIQELPVKKKKKKRIVYSQDELETMMLKSEIRVKKLFTRCSTLLQNIDELRELPDPTDSQKASLGTMATLWIEMVSDLIEIFAMYRWFFSSEKSRKFNVRLRARSSKMSIDQKITRMKYLQNEIVLSQQLLTLPVPDDFKGIAYDKWYDLFVKYALLIAEFEKDAEAAIAIQDIIRHVNVFQNMDTLTQLIGLSVGVLSRDTQIIMNQTRNLLNDHQFSVDAFKLFLASIIPNHEMELTFGDAPSQKFMLRQVKAFDSLRLNESDISGKATITKTNVDLSKDHFLIKYVYAAYLFNNRSYYSTLIYIRGLYKEYPNNPHLLFLAALAHLHRSAQRKTLHSNFQILQGLTYLYEYTQLKDQSDPYEYMECCYNIGRSFHLLNLDYLAIKFYEKVLEIEVDDATYDLKMEAAHNLCFIYNSNRNFKQAEYIMDKFLTI